MTALSRGGYHQGRGGYHQGRLVLLHLGLLANEIQTIFRLYSSCLVLHVCWARLLFSHHISFQILCTIFISILPFRTAPIISPRFLWYPRNGGYIMPFWYHFSCDWIEMPSTLFHDAIQKKNGDKSECPRRRRHLSQRMSDKNTYEQSENAEAYFIAQT